MIEVKNLVKKYGNHLAVNDLSFTVEKGEILGFLGPNGAGKSTTMNMITGYISATEGTIQINGHDIFDEPEEAKKNIGYLPEQPPLYMDMTVKEYLVFAADLKKIPRDKKKSEVERVMRKTGLIEMQTRLIKHLSKGYKQRVGLAQAILGNPELIILDEPTVGLDPVQIIEFRNLIKSLGRDHAVILSSHILTEISEVCDKVMIINKGHLIVSDTPDNLSKMMNSTKRLILEAKGEKSRVHKALVEIPQIKKIEYSEENGIVSANITCSEDIDIREKIFYAMVQANCPILTIMVNKMTLEDIFLEVTKTNGKKVQKKKALENKKEAESYVSNL